MRVEQCRGKFQRDSERINNGQEPFGLYGWMMVKPSNIPRNGDKCCGCEVPCYRGHQ